MSESVDLVVFGKGENHIAWTDLCLLAGLLKYSYKSGVVDLSIAFELDQGLEVSRGLKFFGRAGGRPAFIGTGNY